MTIFCQLRAILRSTLKSLFIRSPTTAQQISSRPTTMAARLAWPIKQLHPTLAAAFSVVYTMTISNAKKKYLLRQHLLNT